MPYGVTFPADNFSDFGETNNLGFALDSEVIVDNDGGWASVGLQITVPTGGEVTFECSFDGSTWTPCTLRGITTDGYLQKINSSQAFLGSIIGARKFRVRTSIAGSANGTVKGRLQKHTSILEGMEHGHPPHKFGFIPIRKSVEFTTTQTATVIWTPESGKKFVVTDYILITNSNNTAIVTIFDGTDNSTNWLIKGNFDPKLAPNLNAHLRTPFISSTANNSLKLTTSAAITINITILGYEV